MVSLVVVLFEVEVVVVVVLPLFVALFLWLCVVLNSSECVIFEVKLINGLPRYKNKA